MGQGKDFLLGGGFGAIGGWIGYHERYHEFRVGPIHGLASLVTYGFGFWSPKGPLLPPPRGPLPPPPRGPLPPPLGVPSLPMPKGPPPLLLIGTICPLVGGVLTSPIRDGLPFHSWYHFLVGMIHDI